MSGMFNHAVKLILLGIRNLQKSYASSFKLSCVPIITSI